MTATHQMPAEGFSTRRWPGGGAGGLEAHARARPSRQVGRGEVEGSDEGGRRMQEE